MEELLLLVHRIPYPPNKGDKIRSYHLLRHLSRNFQVHLGAFVDAPEDWEYAQTLGEHLTGAMKLLPLNPRWAVNSSCSFWSIFRAIVARPIVCPSR